MIDLHTHILFGIDDGARNLDESLALIDMEIEQGVHTVVLTPHFNPLNQHINEFVSIRNNNFEILKQAIHDSGRNIKILKGAEVYYSSKLIDMDLHELVIEGTDYILIEFSSTAMPSNLKGQLSEIQQKGYYPILAHMEKYLYLRDDRQLVLDLINQEVLMQVNASSFLDSRDRSFIKACMKRNWIHLIASDTHSTQIRPPEIQKAAKKIQKYDPQLLEDYMENAEAILNNQIPYVKQPEQIKRILGNYY